MTGLGLAAVFALVAVLLIGGNRLVATEPESCNLS